MEALRGVWHKGNKFIKESGEEIKVYPYTPLLRQFYSKLPLECFILLDDETIKEVVEVPEELKVIE